MNRSVPRYLTNVYLMRVTFANKFTKDDNEPQEKLRRNRRRRRRRIEQKKAEVIVTVEDSLSRRVVYCSSSYLAETVHYLKSCQKVLLSLSSCCRIKGL